MRCVGFPPFFDGESKLLILGSFPSVKSRETDFYYGHKQNRFWKILASFFDEKSPFSVEEKKSFLKKHDIALWDAVVECDIEGSLDSSIKNPVVADLYEVLNNAKIKRIFTNGGKSFALLKRHYPELVVLTDALPSTSPANCRSPEKEWFEALGKVFGK